MKIELYKRKLSNGDQALYYEIYDQRKRIRKSLKLRTKKGNTPEIRAHNKRVMELANQAISKISLRVYSEGVGVFDKNNGYLNFIDYFEKEVKKRPPDRYSWINTLTKLKIFAGSTLTFNQITPQWLEEFKVFLEKEVANSTAHHYYTNIKYTLNKAFKENIILRDPSKLIPGIPLKDTQRTFLEEHEIRKLVETPCSNNDIKNAFLFSCYTGLRLSDVRKLKWGDIQNNKLIFIQKKTSTPEYLTLHEFPLKILELQKHKDGTNVIPLSSNEIFRLLTPSPLLQVLKKWAKNADIKKNISFHVARHTFATLSMTQGVDLYTVSKLLGHKDIQTTQKYAKIIDTKKDEAIRKLPPMELPNA